MLPDIEPRPGESGHVAACGTIGTSCGIVDCSMAKNNYGINGSPNSHIAHPAGLPCFGSLPEFVSRGDVIPAGDIFLRVGNHRGPNSGFGVRHIWAEHENELVRLLQNQKRYLRIVDIYLNSSKRKKELGFFC